MKKEKGNDRGHSEISLVSKTSALQNQESNESVQVAPLWKSCRLAYTLCAFSAAMNLMFVKLNLSFALVCMIKDNKNTNVSQGTFDWDKQTQGHILSAFFHGYMASLMIGGWLSQNLSAKLCFVAGNGGSGLLNFLIPAAAYCGPWYLYAVRLLQGVFSGIMLPSIQLMFATWSHADERTKLLAFSFIGYNVGVVLVNPISSLFCYSNDETGWSYIFYFTGTLMTFCCVAYYFLVFDSIHKHPRISTREKQYILAGTSSDSNTKSVIPYKQIFTSIPVYAYFVTHYCQVFGYASFSITLPLFFKEALSLGKIQNGLISALPACISIATRYLIGIGFRPLLNLSKLSLTNFRKVNHVIGTVVPAAICLAITFVPQKYTAVIILLLCISDSFCDIGYCGSYAPSLIDIAPRFTGFLSALATVVANLPFIAAVEIFGNFISQNGKYCGISAQERTYWAALYTSHLEHQRSNNGAEGNLLKAQFNKKAAPKKLKLPAFIYSPGRILEKIILTYFEIK
ncbi:Sialin, partial [Pseudolycoriella hygida]